MNLPANPGPTRLARRSEQRSSPLLVFRGSLLLVLALVAIACGDRETLDSEVKIRLMTHESFEVTAELLDWFTLSTGIRVEVLKSGDAVQALNQAILSKTNPLADVFYGIDNNLLARALAENLFVDYSSPRAETVPEQFMLDPSHRLTPIAVGDVCLNYDKSFFAQPDRTVPASLADLADPAYANLLVVENPATSSPGLAFMLATIAVFGEHGWLEFWAALRANGVRVADGWSDAYFGLFTVGSGGTGDRPLVVSYATSPPADVVFSETALAEPRIGVVAATCYRQIEFAGILAGSKHYPEAEQVVDFLLSRKFQEDIPLKMFMFPVSSDAQLPTLFTTFSEIVDDPLMLDGARIAANRDTWIAQWTNTVLR